MCCNHDQSSSPATYQTGTQNHLLWGPCPCEARRPLDHGIRHQCRLRQPLPEQQHARRLAPYLPGAAVSTLLELVQSWHQPSTAYPWGCHGTGAVIPPPQCCCHTDRTQCSTVCRRDTCLASKSSITQTKGLMHNAVTCLQRCDLPAMLTCGTGRAAPACPVPARKQREGTTAAILSLQQTTNRHNWWHKELTYNNNHEGFL
jgi:hypothetical protein